MSETAHPSFCRNCTAYCPIIVTVRDGRPVRVTGDPEAPAYDGYTCPKGRTLPEQHEHPERLLHCLARGPGGSQVRIPSARGIDEIASRIRALIDQYGPRSVAIYYGTGNVTNPAGSAMARSFASALGTDLVFSAMAIDKPAANISIALHGHWHAGAQPFETADTWMIVGANPVIAKSNGAPMNNPGQRLKEAVERGLKLVVLDPRRTETAKRAHVHVQALPAQDAAVLASMIHVVLSEQLHDAAFVDRHAQGIQALRAAVAPFSPQAVAGRAGVSADTIVAAARTFAGGRRGCVVCATGASFSAHANLTFYLALCLNTLCGRWAREGDAAPYPNVLLPAFTPRAQPYAPYPVFGNGRMRVDGLRESASGMPTGALAEEILLGGDDGIKALICLGGNPVMSWPDQDVTLRALRSLELLVVLDQRLTATAELAHYVFGIPLSLETAGSTSRVEALKYVGVSRGFSIPWAQYSPRIVDPPRGADVVEDAQFFFRLARRMGLQLSWTNTNGYRQHVESPPVKVMFDMNNEPTNEQLIELTCANSRIPLEVVKQFPHGKVFEEAAVTVAPADPECAARLQLADPMMVRELAALAAEPGPVRAGPGDYLLVSRRINRVMNSVGHNIGRAETHTPAYLHPGDLRELEAKEGDLAEVRSARGAIRVRLNSDETLRRGVVAVAHGFGEKIEAGVTASSVTKLVDVGVRDPITGIPLMSGIAVTLVPLRDLAVPT